MSDNDDDASARARRQWDAVFLRELQRTGGDVDRAIATADQVAPLHAAERRAWIAEANARRITAERRALWLKSRPYRRSKKKPIEAHRLDHPWAQYGRRMARLRRGGA